MSAVQAVTLAATNGHIYALRSDGAVFVLIRAGDIMPNLEVVRSPYWAAAPAVPGTEADVEQQG